MNSKTANRVQLALVGGLIGGLLMGGLAYGVWLSRAIAQPTPDRAPASPVSTAEVNPALTTANNRFGFQLFSQLLQQDQGENLLISPSSVALALSMAYNGANGATQQAMANALQIQNLSLADLNQANAALQTALEAADPQVKLAIANSLWGRSGVTFNPEFLQRNQTFYRAEVETLDFNSPTALEQINGWVSQMTQGKIPTILDRIEPNHALFLINAIYFKGNWSTPFDPAATADRPFYRLDGSQTPHPLMSQRGDYLYAETEQFQAVSLPYGAGRLSMDVFLPKADLSTFYDSLTPERWDLWMQQFTKREGSIQLPRFTTEYSTDLNQALQALGMAVAFDPNQADFSGISPAAEAIDQVRHKTFIKVNEEGTEAAAATSVAVTMTALTPTQPFVMVVDRPFFYTIRDNQTGTLLFMGSVVNPQ